MNRITMGIRSIAESTVCTDGIYRKLIIFLLILTQAEAREEERGRERGKPRRFEPIDQ